MSLSTSRINREQHSSEIFGGNQMIPIEMTNQSKTNQDINQDPYVIQQYREQKIEQADEIFFYY